MNRIHIPNPPKFKPFLAFIVPCLVAWGMIPVLWLEKPHFEPVIRTYILSLPLGYALAFVGSNWLTFQGNRWKLLAGLLIFPLALCLICLIVLLSTPFVSQLGIGLLFFPIPMVFWAWAGIALSVWWVRRLTRMPRTRESRWVTFVICLLVGVWGTLSFNPFWEEVFGIHISNDSKGVLIISNIGLLFGLSQLAFAWLIYKGQQMAFEKANQRVESEQDPLK